MAKTLNGIVTSVNMTETATVEVSRRIPHKLYRKLLARSKKYKVAINGIEVMFGDYVQIEETKPVSKDKYFKLVKVLTSAKDKKHA